MIKTLTNVPVTSYPHYANGFYYVPDDYDKNPDKKYPTIIFFHGKGEAGRDINKLFSAYLPKRIKDGWKPQAVNPNTGSLEDFIVIAVQDGGWSPSPISMSYAMSYFKGTEKLRIDEGRVYATGLSSGGQESLMYGSWLPDSYKNTTAIASFSTAAIDTQALNNLPILGKNKIPIWFSAGTAIDDAHFRENQARYTKIILDNGGDVTTTSHTGGHCCWDQYYNGTKKISYKGKEYTLYEWFLLFGSVVIPREPKTYIVMADSNGEFRAADGDYIPGDTIVLKGNFKSVSLQRINGTKEKPITITNEGTVTVGDLNGIGGSAFSLKTCKFVNIEGLSKESLVINGSVGTGRDTYFGLTISTLSEHINTKNLTIKNCGIALQCKTSPSDDPLTWGTNPPLEEFSFDNIDIFDCSLEAMYVGDTSGYYDLTDKKQVYITPDQFDPTHKYVEQRLLKDVVISNIRIKNAGWDGIQAAAIINLIVRHCDVTNWAIAKNTSHNGGILIGGKTRNSKVFCNKVYDGWGGMLQFYGAGSEHEVYNNFFSNNKGDGAAFRTTNSGSVNFYDNTVWKVGDNCIRVYTGSVNLVKNLLANPRMISGNITPNSYVYVESTGSATEDGNLKYPRIDTLIGNVGYKEGLCSNAPDPCPECPPVPVPVAILMSDGTRYDIK